jgi:hypothetical protein
MSEIGRSVGRAAPRRAWYRHAGSTLAMALGAIYFAANFVPPRAGLVTVLGALAYRSAKKRRLGETEDSFGRQIVEAVLIVPALASVVFQRDLKQAIATDPIATLVIPLWCVLAYAIAALRAWRR